VTSRRTGVTEAGFYIATEGRPRKGGSKVPAGEGGRGGVGVAVTGQRDEDQQGRGRRIEGGRTSKHLRQSSRLTAAEAFLNVKPR